MFTWPHYTGLCLHVEMLLSTHSKLSLDHVITGGEGGVNVTLLDGAPIVKEWMLVDCLLKEILNGWFVISKRMLLQLSAMNVSIWLWLNTSKSEYSLYLDIQYWLLFILVLYNNPLCCFLRLLAARGKYRPYHLPLVTNLPNQSIFWYWVCWCIVWYRMLVSHYTQNKM